MGEIFDEFELEGEVNENDLDKEFGYLPDEYEPWFGEMLEELDSELFNEDLLLE